MRITTRPASMFAWPGEQLTYDVLAEGASELTLAEPDCPGLVPHLLDVHDTGTGMMAHVEIDVGNASFA